MLMTLKCIAIYLALFLNILHCIILIKFPLNLCLYFIHIDLLTLILLYSFFIFYSSILSTPLCRVVGSSFLCCLRDPCEVGAVCVCVGNEDKVK
jgi:hypothetical protein